MYTYLLIDLLILALPLAFSFNKKVEFYKKWKFIWQGILLNLIVFLPWDIAFTKLGVWGFNQEYILGWNLFELPFEEYLFFLVLPFAAIFVYACLEVYFPKDFLYSTRKWIALIFIILSLSLYFTHTAQLYTAVNSLFLSFALILFLLSGKHHFLGHFFLAYFLMLIPFLLVNGILTSLPVFWYQDGEIIGIRLFTIPVEDLLFMMSMLLIPIASYARLSKK